MIAVCDISSNPFRIFWGILFLGIIWLGSINDYLSYEDICFGQALERVGYITETRQFVFKPDPAMLYGFDSAIISLVSGRYALLSYETYLFRLVKHNICI